MIAMMLTTGAPEEERLRINGGSKGGGANEEPLTNTTSMLDVIFILLIFFVSISSLRENSVKINPEKVKSDPSPAPIAEKAESLEIAIDSGNSVYIKNAQIAVGADLERAVADVVARNGTEVKVKIRSDAKSSSGTMLKVLGILSSAGLSRVEFAVAPESAGR